MIKCFLKTCYLSVLCVRADMSIKFELTASSYLQNLTASFCMVFLELDLLSFGFE